MISKRHILLTVLMGAAIVGLLGACAPEQRMQAPDAVAASTQPVVPSIVPLATENLATIHYQPTVSPSTVEPTQVPCQKQDGTRLGIQYVIDAQLDWPAHVVHVRQDVSYRNDTGLTQRDLVFNVEPNREDGHFVLTQVTIDDGRPVSGYQLDGTHLAVPLLEPLHVNCEVGVVMEYDLMLPSIQQGYSEGHLGYMGYSSRQINLGLWFPTMAAYDSMQHWITPPFHSVGEQNILQAADYVVTLTVNDAPDTLHVAGPGEMSRPDSQSWRFELSGGREVALSISDQFQVLSTVTADDVKVELFYFPDPARDTLDAPRHALNTAADALSLYEDLYGAYPYSRMVVVQGDFPDGMEFSGLVFVSDDWFQTWRGIPNDWLTLITAHEVSHQWWYALVGNDQGQYPYIDEALSIYSEELFFERHYPQYVDWWWDFRIMSYEPAGYVDSTVYDFHSVRGYINAVYLRGALMMRSVRQDLGDDVFFAWLHQYAERMRGKVATPEDFWGTLPEGDYALTEQTRHLYLRQSEVLYKSNDVP